MGVIPLINRELAARRINDLQRHPRTPPPIQGALSPTPRSATETVEVWVRCFQIAKQPRHPQPIWSPAGTARDADVRRETRPRTCTPVNRAGTIGFLFRILSV